jgi:homoserine dehydrogenase
MDIESAKSLGYRIKLLAVVKHEGGAIDVRVHPTLVPLEHMLASVMGVFNAVVVNGDIVGQTVYYGRGAGRLPTASAVVSDISDAARHLVSGAGVARSTMADAGSVTFRKIGDVRTRFYLRLMLQDKPGVMGAVATVLGQHNISLASVMQKEPHSGGRSVPVIILTHPAREMDIDAAIRALEEMQAIGTKSVRLRVEDLGIEK